jgi:hypothetical protein
MDFIAGLFELLGLWIVGNKSKWGFIINIIGGICWVLYVMYSGHTYGLLVVVIPALFINTRNFIKWKKNV